MSGHSVDRLIAEARRHLDAADERQRSADDEKWAAAELLWRLNRREGLSQRAIAERVDRSQQSVGHYVNVWQWNLDNAHSQKPAFTEAYYEMRGPSGSRQGIADREVRKAARERPEAIAEAIEQAPPEAQREIADAIVARQIDSSLKDVAEKPQPKPRQKKPTWLILSDATFDLWQVAELLKDEVPSGETKIRMVASAEKAERLARGIAWLLDTGEIEAGFAELLDTMGTEA